MLIRLPTNYLPPLDFFVVENVHIFLEFFSVNNEVSDSVQLFEGILESMSLRQAPYTTPYVRTWKTWIATRITLQIDEKNLASTLVAFPRYKSIEWKEGFDE